MDGFGVSDLKEFPPLGGKQISKNKVVNSPPVKKNKTRNRNRGQKQPSPTETPKRAANDVEPHQAQPAATDSYHWSNETLDLECITPDSPLHKCHLCSKTFPPHEAKQHMLALTHLENRRRLSQSLYYLQLENPPQDAISKLESFLCETSKKKMFNPKQVEIVDDFINLLNQAIMDQVNPKASVRLFGSWLSGLAIEKISDVNLDLLYGQKVVRTHSSISESDDRSVDESNEENNTEDNPAQILSKIATFLSSISGLPEGVTISHVKYEYEKSIPSVNFKLNIQKNFNLKFEILLYGQRSYETSMLIKKYAQLDSRFLTLARCLRIWANTCSLDDQESGTWPPHAFTIMLISFLQKRDPPVLPYLQEAGKETSESLRDKLNDPECQEMENIPDKSLESIMKVSWTSQNTESIGVLWLEFFRHYATQFRAGKEVLSIRKQNSASPLTHKDKGWTSKIIAIEEPFRAWLNLSRTVGKREIYDVFMHILRESFAYFVIPHDKNCPIYNQSDFQLLRVPFKDLNATLGNMSLCDDSNDPLNDTSDPESESDGEGSDSEEEKYKDSSARFREAKILAAKFGLILAPQEQVTLRTVSLDYSNSKYSFAFSEFNWFKNPSKFCHVCRKSGHSAKQCPTANLPKLVPLPDTFPKEHLDYYSKVFNFIYDRNKITPERTREHEAIAEYLQNVIRAHFETALITLFGSSVNGFGSDNCDVDLCMTFEGNETGQNVDQKTIIEKLAKILRQCPRIVRESVLPIVHAKVPICKFQYKKKGDLNCVECDISLYNILALSNTRMLRTYTIIDDRVSILGTVVKHFAKVCDIGDASRGSLSSYAYTLMTLHYLQQVKIIPVLQELYVGKKPMNLVDRWNTWFFDDLTHLHEVWPYRGLNRASIAELFIGFLRYYAEEFQFEKYVVCCRRLEKLSRLEKMWTGKKISIEDPFLHKHNLGQGLDNRMATFIKSCFILGRNHFGNSLLDPSCRQRKVIELCTRLFDKKLITNGPLPSGRGCRICHKVAHKLRDCPLRKVQRQNKNPPVCRRCNKTGHQMQNCPQRPDKFPKNFQQQHPMHHQNARGGHQRLPNNVPYPHPHPPIPNPHLNARPMMRAGNMVPGLVPRHFLNTQPIPIRPDQAAIQHQRAVPMVRPKTQRVDQASNEF